MSEPTESDIDLFRTRERAVRALELDRRFQEETRGGAPLTAGEIVELETLWVPEGIWIRDDVSDQLDAIARKAGAAVRSRAT
jgi:hypothetical protein